MALDLTTRMLYATVAACVRRSSTACTRTSSSNASSNSNLRSVAGCTIICWPHAVMPGKNARSRCACMTSRPRCPRLKRSGPRWPGCSRRCSRTSPCALIWPSRRSSAAARMARNRDIRAFGEQGRYDSITFPQVPVGCRLEAEDKRVRVANVGRVKVLLHRPVEGTPKTATIRRSSTGKWYVCFSCECAEPEPLPPTGQHVGIDVGLATFATLTAGAPD